MFADGYSTSDIDMIWHDGNKESVKLSPDLQLPQFRVLGINTYTDVFITSTGQSISFLTDYKS